MRPRHVALLLSAVVIVGLCTWRTAHRSAPGSTGAGAAALVVKRPAPRFSLYDQSGKLAKLERYLGRTRLLVLFLGPQTNLADDPLLGLLSQHAPAILALGVQPVVVTLATPAAVRAAEAVRGAPYSFPMLTDVDPQQPRPTPAHIAWGRIDRSSGKPVPGLFLIDRGGNVEFTGPAPTPVEDAATMIVDLAAGRGPAR